MLIYIALTFITILFILIAKKKNQNVFLFILVLLMLLVCGLRGLTVGIDTKSYIDSFRYGVEEYFLVSGEILFNITYGIIHLFSSSWNIWLLFVSSLIFMPLLIILKNESPMPVFSVLIFMVSMSHFFPESMNIIRQSIATSFILVSYYLWNKDKKIYSLIILLTAALFHITSIIALPFLFLKNLKFSKNFIIISISIVTILGFTGSYGFINDYILNISGFNVGINEYASVIFKYSKYGDSSGANINGYIYAILPFSILCLITIPISENDNQYKFYYNVLFVCTILYSLISSIDYAFRIIYGQIIVQILVIPFAYKYGTQTRKILLILYTAIIIIIYFFYLNSLKKIHYGSIVPYRFFWE